MPGGRVYIGNYNATGLMLKHVFDSVDDGKLFEGASLWALNALSSGPEANGTPNFGEEGTFSQVAESFGFEIVGLRVEGQNGAIVGQGWGDGYPKTIEMVLRKVSEHPGDSNLTTEASAVESNIEVFPPDKEASSEVAKAPPNHQVETMFSKVVKKVRRDGSYSLVKAGFRRLMN